MSPVPQREQLPEGGDVASGADGGGSPDRTIDPIERRLQALRELPEVRLDKIAAMRKAINEGDFDTPERLYAAISRMIDELHRAK